MSFVLDPPLMVAGGAAIGRLAEDEAQARLLRGGLAATFVGVSVALYANAPGLGAIWRPFGSRSGREFMLTSGLAKVEGEQGPARHAAALSLFALYPLWVRLGYELGRRTR